MQAQRAAAPAAPPAPAAASPLPAAAPPAGPAAAAQAYGEASRKLAGPEAGAHTEPAERADRARGAAGMLRAAPPALSNAAPAAAPAAPAAVEVKEDSLSADEWIKRIIELRRNGRDADADASLKRFAQKFPDYRIPAPARGAER
jgi:hypothetical protein